MISSTKNDRYRSFIVFLFCLVVLLGFSGCVYELHQYWRKTAPTDGIQDMPLLDQNRDQLSQRINQLELQFNTLQNESTGLHKELEQNKLDVITQQLLHASIAKSVLETYTHTVGKNVLVQPFSYPNIRSFEIPKAIWERYPQKDVRWENGFTLRMRRNTDTENYGIELAISRYSYNQDALSKPATPCDTTKYNKNIREVTAIFQAKYASDIPTNDPCASVTESAPLTGSIAENAAGTTTVAVRAYTLHRRDEELPEIEQAMLIKAEVWSPAVIGDLIEIRVLPQMINDLTPEQRSQVKKDIQNISKQIEQSIVLEESACGYGSCY